MKATTIIAALSMSIFNVAEACYGSGDNWPNQEEARIFVEFACSGNGYAMTAPPWYTTNHANIHLLFLLNRGMFTGQFGPLQTKSMCPRATSNNLGLRFEVQNLNTRDSFDLGNGDCYEKLTSQIFQCGKGGEITVAGWRFK